MNYWLLKTDPGSFSIDDLARAPGQTTAWDGVRNFQARNMLRDAMRPGDLAFLYHSSCALPGIVGSVKVTRSGYLDVTAFNPRDHHFDPRSTPARPLWYCVDITLKQRFAQPVTLAELRAQRVLHDMLVLRRGNRLSVTPITAKHWKHIIQLTASR
ncbi:MAG: EVE domain-containing protein [Gammaproteobacteria bacterium]